MKHAKLLGALIAGAGTLAATALASAAPAAPVEDLALIEETTVPAPATLVAYGYAYGPHRAAYGYRGAYGGYHYGYRGPHGYARGYRGPHGYGYGYGHRGIADAEPASELPSPVVMLGTEAR